MSFNKCLEHTEYEEGIIYNEFMEQLIDDGFKPDDYVCDEAPSDYGYEYCEECDKYIQVE